MDNLKLGLRIDEHGYRMFYMGVTFALGFSPSASTIGELASLTCDADDMVAASAAMKRAPESQRIFAALEVLRARRTAAR
jgi:hypothetical protein